MMKFIAWSIFGIVPLFGSTPADASGQCILASEKAVFSGGEPVTVSVFFKNDSEKSVEIPATFFPQKYWLSFDISTEAGDKLKFVGQEVKLKGYGDKVRIFPGFQYGRTFDLREMFPLSKGRSYRVKARFGIGPDGKPLAFGLIQSQELTIKIE